MKILFITPGRGMGGGHLILTNIARELKKEGYNINVYCIGMAKNKRDIHLDNIWKDINEKFIDIPKSRSEISKFNNFLNKSKNFLIQNIDKYDRIVFDSHWIFYSAILANVISKKHIN